MEELLANCADCIRCPAEDCLTPFFIHPGDETAAAPSTVIGLDGKPLAGVALRHFNQHRFRCPCCGQDFCSACLAMPYHAGQTCEEARSASTIRSCRFCAAIIEPSLETPGEVDDEATLPDEGAAASSRGSLPRAERAGFSASGQP